MTKTRAERTARAELITRIGQRQEFEAARPGDRLFVKAANGGCQAAKVTRIGVARGGYNTTPGARIVFVKTYLMSSRQWSLGETPLHSGKFIISPLLKQAREKAVQVDTAIRREAARCKAARLGLD